MSEFDRRFFCKTSAMSLMALSEGLPVAETSVSDAESAGTRPLLSGPYATQPGEPVFLLEGSTLEDLWAVRRRVNPLVRSSRNPVMVKTRDWEGGGPTGNSVLYDSEDKLFKMWYTVAHEFEYRHRLPGSYMMCYATSGDGYAWEKPELGVLEWKGSKKNNFIGLVGRRPAGSVMGTPPGSGISQRYICSYLDDPGICLAYSDDGVKWTAHKRNPIEPSESDTRNTLVYDPVNRKWMVFMRPPVFAGFTNRRMAVMESRDLQAWTRPETVLLPDEADLPESYGMPVFRRGNLFFGLLWVYNRLAGTIENELVFSSDGRHWNRVPPRELFLPLGGPGEFDQGMVFAGPPVIAHGEMRFYYGATRTLHTQIESRAAIGLASVPLDRFFALRTSSQNEPGFILTRPLLLNGSKLEVNAEMLLVQGQIKVAVLDLSGKELPGFGMSDCEPLRGNDLRHEVTWKKGKLADLPKEPLRLKFQLEQATFYAFYLK
ncbi:MAG: hypothetical protein AB1898_27520 [Acidobacteriota bacterium]